MKEENVKKYNSTICFEEAIEKKVGGKRINFYLLDDFAKSLLSFSLHCQSVKLMIYC